MTANVLSESTRSLYRTLVRTALVAAGFCVVAGFAMLLRHSKATLHDPLLAPEAIALDRQLLAEPRNEHLMTRIRDLDLDLRRRYWRNLSFNRTGSWLLLFGIVVGVLMAKEAVRLTEKPPAPTGIMDTASRLPRLATSARWSVGAAGVIAAIVFVTLALSTRTPLPGDMTGLAALFAERSDEADSAPVDLPTPEEYGANWPRFLGPAGNAIAPTFSLPTELDFASGKGVLWKAEVPTPGFNSPIAWGDRVFLSGGTEERREVLCYSASTGDELWRRSVENVPGTPARLPEVAEQPGLAASTMATDGRRAYVLFANADLAAFSFEGDPVWSKNLGVPDNPYGHAISLLTWRDKLIVQFDQGDGDDGKSRLYALDGKTGEVAWETRRAFPASWATPILFETAGKPLIAALGGEIVVVYSAADGGEIWRAECITGEIAPSPIFTGGLLVVVSPSDSVIGIRPDGEGDVTETHIAWMEGGAIPDITSPVGNDAFVFTVATYGTVTGFSVKSGELLWEHELEFDVNATPAIAGKDRLIVFGNKGRMVVAEAGTEYRELMNLEIGSEVHASPAFVGARMFIRTSRSLICVGADQASAGTPE